MYSFGHENLLYFKLSEMVACLVCQVVATLSIMIMDVLGTWQEQSASSKQGKPSKPVWNCNLSAWLRRRMGPTATGNHSFHTETLLVFKAQSGWRRCKCPGTTTDNTDSKHLAAGSSNLLSSVGRCLCCRLKDNCVKVLLKARYLYAINVIPHLRQDSRYFDLSVKVETFSLNL